MSEHNIFNPNPGAIVIYGEWNGSAYVEFQALIRVVISTPAGQNEPTINLSYSDGVGAADIANNVRNIEVSDLGANEDYWRAQFEIRAGDSRPFATNYRPSQGKIVWIAFYDTAIEEHRFFLAFVRAIPGNPNDQTPNVNLTYFDSRPGVEDSVNANNVLPVEEAGATDSYWFKAVNVSE